MRAWLINELSGISQIRKGEVPDPVPRAGEVLLDLNYAGLNPADRYLAEGQYPARPPLPHILGRDGCGVVAQVGEGVTGIRVGETRCLLRGAVGVERPGTFADRVAVPVENLVEIPSGWEEREAAGASLVYLTAFQALTNWGSLPAKSVVLVTGASGGVGVASVQLAHAMGYRVLALSRSSEKSEKLKELGAEMVFNPEDRAWRNLAKQHLGSSRVDLAIDNIGGKLLPQVIDTLGDQGKISLVGRLAGPVPEFNTASLFFRRIRMGGIAVGAYSNAESRDSWRQVVELLGRTGARPLVDQVFSFDEVPQAFERLAKGPLGKVLIKIRS